MKLTMGKTVKMEHLFCDLPRIVREQQLIRPMHTQSGPQDCWRALPYQTKLGSGNMLVAAENALPGPVTLSVNLTGWHRVYIGMLDLRGENYTYLKLTGDTCYTGFRHARGGNPRQWAVEEYAEEVYFTSADLSGKDFVLAKPDSRFDNISGLAWIRCERMTDDEVAAHLALEAEKKPCVQMHIDGDLYAEDSFPTEQDYLIRLEKLRNTNTDFCSLEYSFDYDAADLTPEQPLHRGDLRWSAGQLHLVQNKDAVYRRYLQYAHENGITLYAANRMSVAGFSVPYMRWGWKTQFPQQHPEYRCVARDGSVSQVCSYAYPQVQEYVLQHMKQAVAYGFDGVSLIFHRGVHIGFEQPVLQRFGESYPGVNPLLLPVTDERLHGVWCEVMTDFMCRLRDVLGNRIKVNVITDYGLESAKNFGLDIRSWAAMGLVDSVSQGDIETVEDLTDCMSEEDPGLIDLQKYALRIQEAPVIRRFPGTDLKKVLAYIPEYLQLEKQYGVKVYHVLPWTNIFSQQEYLAYVQALQKAGAKRFLAWNSYSSEWNLPEWYHITHLGSREDSSLKLRRFVRLLTLDGCDISHYQNNWRG